MVILNNDIGDSAELWSETINDSLAKLTSLKEIKKIVGEFESKK